MGTSLVENLCLSYCRRINALGDAAFSSGFVGKQGVMNYRNARAFPNRSLTRMFCISGQMTQLCELINKSGELLAKNLSHLDTVLGALDVQEHSLGVLAVL